VVHQEDVGAGRQSVLELVVEHQEHVTVFVHRELEVVARIEDLILYLRGERKADKEFEESQITRGWRRYCVIRKRRLSRQSIYEA
jgi:hypothetical protein